MKEFITYSAANSVGWKKEGLRSKSQAEKFLLPTLGNKDGTDVRREIGPGNVLSPVTGTVTSSAVEMDDDAKEKRGFQPAGEKFEPKTWNFESRKKTPGPGLELAEVIAAKSPAELARQAADEADAAAKEFSAKQAKAKALKAAADKAVKEEAARIAAEEEARKKAEAEEAARIAAEEEARKKAVTK